MNAHPGNAMQDAELIRRIVEQVLEQLAPVQGAACVCVLAERDEALAQALTPLVASHFGSGTKLMFRGESGCGAVPAAFLLPELSCSDMADLAAGRAASPVMRDVLSLLLKGTGVGVVRFAYRDYAQSAPGPLYDLYAGYEKTLAGFGLKEFKAKKPENRRLRDRLVTAAMVEEAAADGARSLEIPERAVLTPLAAERAETLHVSIRRQG